MTVLLFLLLPALIVAAYALYQWARTRQPSSVESGVDAFRREMRALSPEARPATRRPDPGPSGPAGRPTGGEASDPRDGRPPAPGGP
jgi:hypothetical protein